jgi:diazepam-binding inhibitor (GABA receptor modulator, acyl-CoA-binding protein)
LIVVVITLFFFLQRFEAATEEVKTLTKRPTDVELLELYALFKQATVGDNDTS